MTTVNETNLRTVTDVSRCGAGAFRAATAGVPPEEWKQLADEWRGMPVDEYLPEGATYRSRRYGRVQATNAGDGWALQPMGHQAFCQAAEVVPLYGGRARMFPPVPEATIASSAMQALLRVDLDLVSQVETGRESFVLGLHMVRVTALPSQHVSPAPEGRHRDGHMFVIMHLIAREHCTGGVSRVFDDDVLVLETTMEHALDTVIVDDRRVEHEVDPIAAVDTAGWRDTLLVDFDWA